MMNEPNKFKTGDRVVCVKTYTKETFPTDKSGWANSWVRGMGQLLVVGKEYTINLYEGQNTIVGYDVAGICHYSFPSSCFELVKEHTAERLGNGIYAIWPYDMFPYVLSGKAISIDEECVKVEAYGTFRRNNVRLVDYDPSKSIENLRNKHTKYKKELLERMMDEALVEIPELKVFKKYAETK